MGVFGLAPPGVPCLSLCGRLCTAALTAYYVCITPPTACPRSPELNSEAKPTAGLSLCHSSSEVSASARYMICASTHEYEHEHEHFAA